MTEDHWTVSAENFDKNETMFHGPFESEDAARFWAEKHYWNFEVRFQDMSPYRKEEA